MNGAVWALLGYWVLGSKAIGSVWRGGCARVVAVKAFYRVSDCGTEALSVIGVTECRRIDRALVVRDAGW